jgi:hypothetical protein
MEAPPTPHESPKFPQPTFASIPVADDPIAAYLALARAEKIKAEASWLSVSSYGEDGTGIIDLVQGWTQIVCTLEALESAARISRLLHGDCVQLPSRDPRHLRDPLVLHSLLMQQLNSLTTRLGNRHNVTGAVPLAIRPPQQPGPLPPVPTNARVKTEEEGDEDDPQEEDQGGSCTIT